MKQAELQEVVDKLTAMENEYEAKKAKKKELEDNINLCKLKLERAEKLLSGILFLNCTPEQTDGLKLYTAIHITNINWMFSYKNS